MDDTLKYCLGWQFTRFWNRTRNASSVFLFSHSLSIFYPFVSSCFFFRPSLLQYRKRLICWGGKLISAEVCSEADSLMWASLHPPWATQSTSALSLSNPFKHTGLKKNTRQRLLLEPRSALMLAVFEQLHSKMLYWWAWAQCALDEPWALCIHLHYVPVMTFHFY